MIKASRNAKGLSAEEWSKAGSFMRKPERGWLHSDQAIKEGGVCYALKYLGCIEVLKSMRTLQYDIRQHVTKEAMYRCCEANGYKFSKRKKPSKNVVKLLADHPRTTHSGTFISLTVSVSGILLTDISSGEVISKHDMQGISFASGGEKDCPDIVGYVAKDAKNRRACHVLDCPQNLSFDVINTIGQAFEIRYKMFLEDPPQLLTTPRRFVDAIFEEDEKPMEHTYDEPKDEAGFHYRDDEFDYDHQYDSVSEDNDKHSDDDDHNVRHSYQTPRPRQPPVKMSCYDTLEPTLDTRLEGDYPEQPKERNASMRFAVGTQFDTAATGPPVSTPSYNNPLASPLDANRGNDNFYDNPGNTVSTAQPEANKAPSRSTWETFDDEPAAGASSKPIKNGFTPLVPVPAPAAKSSESADDETNPLHNTLGYALPLPRKLPEAAARKIAPPLPKPYSRQNKGDTSNKPMEDKPKLKPVEDKPKPVEGKPKSENDLASCTWYHGQMTRQEAEKVLSRDGDFLVRESTTNPGQYVLSGQQNGYPKHLLLVDPQGVVRTRDQSFDSVGHLIRYHQDNKVPIISSGSVLILKQPVPKNVPSVAIYDIPV